MTRILVIGATGYIGRTLLARAGGLARGTSSTPTEGLLHLQLGAPLAFDDSQIDAADTVLMTAAISAPDVRARKAATMQLWTSLPNTIGKQLSEGRANTWLSANS